MLKENVKQIVEDIKSNNDNFVHNNKIFKCMRGDQLSVLKDEFLSVESPIARNNKIKNAVSLNYIQKIVSKLSQIYTFEVERKSNVNQDLLDFYVSKLNVDTCMQNANELFNGMKSVLVEIYQKKDLSLAIRPIPSDRFFVWSDDLLEPNIPTVFIKVVGFCKSLKNNKQKAELFFAYTDTEFLAFDSEGNVRDEYMAENNGENPFGIAPFIYINRDVYDLIPTPNKDLLQNVVGVCSILSDAAVANYFQSFPIRILKNVDIESSKIDINAHSVVVLNSASGSTFAPEFTELASSLDTSKSINLAKEILQQLLYTFDIAADGAVTESQSGLALTIKASDTLDNRKKQIEFFKPAEKELWNRIAIIHNNIVKRNVVSVDTPKTTFDKNFTVEIEFELPSTEVEQKKAINEAESESKDMSDSNKIENKEDINNLE